MNTEELEYLKYPIGKFRMPEQITVQLLADYISTLAVFPGRLRREVSFLNETQLDTRYRPEGWTIRQVVHHCADSHYTSFTRFKLALTEDKPTIKPYAEERWAELPDSLLLPVEPSLSILDGLHERWVFLLNELTSAQLQRCFIHPEHGIEISLQTSIGEYAWHCNHHLSQIMVLKERYNWD